MQWSKFLLVHMQQNLWTSTTTHFCVTACEDRRKNGWTYTTTNVLLEETILLNKMAASTMVQHLTQKSQVSPNPGLARKKLVASLKALSLMPACSNNPNSSKKDAISGESFQG